MILEMGEASERSDGKRICEIDCQFTRASRLGSCRTLGHQVTVHSTPEPSLSETRPPSLFKLVTRTAFDAALPFSAPSDTAVSPSSIVASAA